MKTVLFCGRESSYVFAHIQPLFQSQFNIISVVLPTLRKWHALLEKVSGKKASPYDLFKKRIKATLKKGVSRSLMAKHPKIYAKTVNTETILKKQKVPYWSTDDVNSKDLMSRLKSIEPDLFLCVGYPQIFSRELLAIPAKGAVNIHPSLLPKFRGPSPFFWIIAQGEAESGVTAHFMTQHIDAGDIIAQIKFPIPDFTHEALVRRCVEETPTLIRQIWSFFSEGKQKPQKQDDSKASYFRLDRESDHRLHWNKQRVEHIYNLTRTGKAFCFYGAKKVMLTDCSISDKRQAVIPGPQVEAGTVVNISEDSLEVKALDGSINVHQVVYKNRRMRPQKIAKRLNIRIGKKFS